jgi:hypothetical protein
MTKRHCPTCQQVWPERLPLPVRVRAALAAAGHPIRPRDLRRMLEVTDAVLYQTLRRMADRGEIRRVITAEGNGYILVPEQGDTPSPEDDPAVSAVNDLRLYVESVGGIVKDRAVNFMERLGVEHRQAEVMLASALEAGVFSESNGRIYA